MNSESIYTPEVREHAKVVADTIIDQLGGAKFVMMTGAKNFVYDPARPGRLTFRLPMSKWNYVVIQLTPMDLYEVEFSKITTRNCKMTVTPGPKHEGVYFDQLRSVFEGTTGLRTRL
jgi:hypothetical protein